MHRKPVGYRAETDRVSPTAPESKSASANVWGILERMPDFNERVRRGKAQLDRGERAPFADDEK